MPSSSVKITCHLHRPSLYYNLPYDVWCEAQIPCTSGDNHSIILPLTTLICPCDPEANNYHSPLFRQRLLPQLPLVLLVEREQMNPLRPPSQDPHSNSSRLGGP